MVKTKDYMNWRYLDPASGRFTVRAAEEQGKLLGYLVFKVTEDEDLEFLNDPNTRVHLTHGDTDWI